MTWDPHAPLNVDMRTVLLLISPISTCLKIVYISSVSSQRITSDFRSTNLGFLIEIGIVWWSNTLHIIIQFFETQFFVSSHMYPDNPEGTQVIVGSMNMWYLSDTARNRTRNLFRPKREAIPLNHSDWLSYCLFLLPVLWISNITPILYQK